MEIISVNTTGCYEVCVGSGLFENMATRVRSITNARRICIVSDGNVWPLWGNAVQKELEYGGYTCVSFVIPSGEAQKNITTCTRLWEFLAEQELDRADCLVALGGGVIGDLTGFAAATYLRGIDYIQVPTTLLAMVDSSVGGKTAVNLTAGKNLAGAFYQPKLVLCNTDTLTTLPQSDFLEGCAEVIKYAILYDPQLFSLLETTGSDFPKESVIAKCIRHKALVVAEDEFDRGQRMLLNLGHTIGHAFEILSDYEMSHGQAVAAGIGCVCRSAAEICSMDTQVCRRILALLEKFSLPDRGDFPLTALLEVMERDKKRSADNFQLVIPQDIGKCKVERIHREKLKDFIQKGL